MIFFFFFWQDLAWINVFHSREGIIWFNLHCSVFSSIVKRRFQWHFQSGSKMCVTLLCYFSVAGECSLEKTIRVVMNDLHYFLCIKLFPWESQSSFLPIQRNKESDQLFLWLKFHWSVLFCCYCRMLSCWWEILM